jgi:hypothetical protein
MDRCILKSPNKATQLGDLFWVQTTIYLGPSTLLNFNGGFLVDVFNLIILHAFVIPLTKPYPREVESTLFKRAKRKLGPDTLNCFIDLLVSSADAIIYMDSK